MKHNFRDISEFFNNSNLNRIAVVDIETTGLTPDTGLIVEIAIVELDLETGITKNLFESLINEPQFDENARYSWIFNNSDLKYSEVLKAPKLTIFKSRIQEILNYYHMTAYNKYFDFGFLKSRGFSIRKEVADIMETAKNVCRIIKPNGALKNPNFQETWNHFFPNKFYIEKHRAADDALHEALVLFEMYQQGYFKINFNKSNY